MKKIIIPTLIFILMFATVVLAAGTQKGIHEPGTGLAEPELREAGQGTGQGISNEAGVQTQNMGEDQQVLTQAREQVQARQQLRAGDYTNENGEQLQVQQGEQNRMHLMVGGADAASSLEIVQEQVQERTRLHAKLSNGKDAEIKIMPDTASERARERLQLKVCSAETGCSIELKEVGQGEQVRAAYEVQAQKQSKLLGLFGKKMQVRAQIDAENGEVIQAKKPWWAFLASE
ncbi:hypothetical protein JW898_06115 [Candidatus Woesearchaeota archaeon]|nr:hypothetical protein [Candidatus Woesearchaeota archaeon]